MQHQIEILDEAAALNAIEAGEYDEIDVEEGCSVLIIWLSIGGELVRQIEAPKTHHLSSIAHDARQSVSSQPVLT